MSGPLKVLVIEHNPGEARRILELLDEAGYADWWLPTVERLDAGLAWLERAVADAVILDLTLPGAHGAAALSAITRAHPDLPIVVLAASGDEETADQALQEGAQDYLVRGQFDGARLGQALRYAVERKKSDQGLRAYTRRLELLREVDQAILQADVSDAIAGTALELLRHLLPCRRMSVTLEPDGPTGKAVVLAVQAAPTTQVGPGARLSRDTMDVDWLWEGEPHVLRKPLELQDAPPVMQHLYQEGVRYIVNVPLLVGERIVGSLNLGFHDPAEATQQAVEFAQDVADHLAIALHRAQLRERAIARPDAGLTADC